MLNIRCSKVKAVVKDGKIYKHIEFRLMAIYRGKKVSLNKVMRGDVKKFKVFVKKGNRVVKVNFGDKNMKIKKNIPARKKSFLARHKCSTAKDRTTKLDTGPASNGVNLINQSTFK